MSLRTALDRLIVIQSALTITEPIALTVKKAYKYIPGQNVALPDYPAFLNEWTMAGQGAHPSMRELAYRIHMQCLVGRANIEDEIVADQATAMWEKFVNDLGQDINLDNNVTIALLSGMDPTLALFDRAGQPYIGFQAFLDIRLVEAITWRTT